MSSCGHVAVSILCVFLMTQWAAVHGVSMTYTIVMLVYALHSMLSIFIPMVIIPPVMGDIKNS